MSHGGEFPYGGISDFPSVHLVRIPVDSTWPAAPAPVALEHDLDDFIRLAVARSARDNRVRLQHTIDGVESQIVQQPLVESGLVNSPQELLRHNLIGVQVADGQRRSNAFDRSSFRQLSAPFFAHR